MFIFGCHLNLLFKTENYAFRATYIFSRQLYKFAIINSK